jgi:hypothetical protein
MVRVWAATESFAHMPRALLCCTYHSVMAKLMAASPRSVPVMIVPILQVMEIKANVHGGHNNLHLILRYRIA